MSSWSELWGDQSDAFNQFGDETKQLAGAYNPWVNRGNTAQDMWLQQMQRMIANPNAIQDQISKGFYLSPYQQNLQNLTQQRMNFNAANTGMLGSGAANSALQNQLLDNTGKFQNDYVANGMHDYDLGFGGLSGLSQMGLNALGKQSDLMSDADAATLKANQSKMGANSKMWGSALGALGGLASFIPGIGTFLGGALSGFGKGMGNSWNNPNQSTADIGGG